MECIYDIDDFDVDNIEISISNFNYEIIDEEKEIDIYADFAKTAKKEGFLEAKQIVTESKGYLKIEDIYAVGDSKDELELLSNKDITNLLLEEKGKQSTPDLFKKIIKL